MFISTAYNETNKILDEKPSKYNGRVNIAEPSETAIFEMQEKINVRNKTSNYREALTGNIEENVSASRSRIQDTDFATETAEMTVDQEVEKTRDKNSRK